MERSQRCVSGAAALIFIGMFFTNAFAGSGSAYWNEESIEAAITDRLSAEIAAKYRFSDDANGHYYTSTEIDLNYEFLPWLEAGIGYKEVFKLKNDAWQQENRPFIQGEVSWKTGQWKFKNRARLELREKQGQDSYYRFRDKFAIKSPSKWTAAEINPYVADEIFIEEREGEGFNENRAYVGVAMKLVERVSLDVYYLYNVERSDRQWDERVHVIGTELKLKY